MDLADVRAALQEDQVSSLLQRDRLRRDLDEIIAAAADVATDDEHDPEGATIAYERSRANALLDQIDAHLAEIALALEGLDAGSYGTCINCGDSIGWERLQARPIVRTCIECAQ